MTLSCFNLRSRGTQFKILTTCAGISIMGVVTSVMLSGGGNSSGVFLTGDLICSLMGDFTGSFGVFWGDLSFLQIIKILHEFRIYRLQPQSHNNNKNVIILHYFNTHEHLNLLTWYSCSISSWSTWQQHNYFSSRHTPHSTY